MGAFPDVRHLVCSGVSGNVLQESPSCHRQLAFRRTAVARLARRLAGIGTGLSDHVPQRRLAGCSSQCHGSGVGNAVGVDEDNGEKIVIT